MNSRWPISTAWCIGYAAATWACAARAETWVGRADLAFSGVSTLHEFRGHGTTDVFKAEVSPDGRAVTCGAEVRVLSLTTDEKARDKNMYAMFRAKEFPTISASVSGVQGAAAAIPMKITIVGRDQTIDATAFDWTEASDKVSFTLSFNISLAKSGLKAPTAMAGLIKVADIVHVVIRADFVREPGSDLKAELR